MKQPQNPDAEIPANVAHSRQYKLEQRLLSMTAAVATLLLLIALAGLSFYNSDVYKNPYFPSTDNAQLTSYSTPVYQFFVPPGWRIVKLDPPMVAREIGSREFIAIDVETTDENLLAPQLLHEANIMAMIARAAKVPLGTDVKISINRVYKSEFNSVPALRFDFETGTFSGRGLCLLSHDARLTWIGCWESPKTGFIRRAEAHIAAVGFNYIRLKPPYTVPVYERPFIRQPSVSPNVYEIWPRMETTMTELETNDSLAPEEQSRLKDVVAKDLTLIAASGKRPAWAVDFFHRLVEFGAGSPLP
jgi:hypothetical protein